MAREAGVSIASVSRVINGNDCVADFTRTRILEVIDRLKYVPHYGAHSLVTRRNNLIGVLLPALHGEFFSQLVCGIEDAARRHGMHILISNSSGDEEQDARVVAALRGRVGGLLVMASHERPALLAERLPEGVPAVLLNTRCPDRHNNTLMIDNYGAAVAVMRHLAVCGRRRVVHIAGPRTNSDAAERLRGYRDGLAANWPGVAPLIIDGDFSQDSGARAARRIAALPECPDAVFAANDLIAIGAGQALNEAGFAIPDDLALVGFDDIPLANLVTPALTTMRIDIAEFGRRGLERLVRCMEEPDAVHGEMEAVRPTLVIRGSCGRGLNNARANA
ncbi:MAG: LacI family DNA-binding transcriptional regulator [Woeseiaceae bacterium]